MMARSTYRSDIGYIQGGDGLFVCVHDLAYLAVSVLHGRNIRLAEGALDKAQDERGFANAAGSKHHNPVVVALLRHPADDNVDI